MNALSVLVIMAGAITAYVGISHFWLHLKRPRRADLLFAVTCLFMVGYDLSAAFHYSAQDIASGGFWQRMEIAFATSMGMPFLLFVNEQVELETPPLAMAALVGFPLAGLLALVDPWQVLLSTEPLIKTLHTPWESYSIYEYGLGPLFTALALLVPSMLLHCVWVAVGAPRYRKGRLVRRSQRSSPLISAGVLALLSLSHDLFVAHGQLDGPYLFEYGFFAITVVMSWTLVKEVTQASHTKRTLEVTTRRESTTLHAIQDAVITTDLEGKIVDLNPAAERLLAVRLAHVTGKALSEYVEITSADTNTIVPDPVRFALGRPPNPYGKLPQLVTTDGSERRIDLGGAPLKDQDGHVEGAIVVMRDLTLQHHALGSLEHAKKMESMGQLAGGAAHDLNNLLTPIMSYVELVQRDLAPDSRSAQFLGHVQDAATRAAALTRQLLALSRKQVLHVQTVPLAEFVRQTVPLLERLVADHAKLQVDIPEDAGKVRVDLGQFEQVLLNLVSNAKDAVSEGGTISIRVRRLTDTESCIEVSDTGIGMDRSTVSRIFEPFFTTKERGKGTGLGLASVRGIVEQHDGFIYVDSEPGEGSCFEVILPTTQVEARVSSVRGVPRKDFRKGNESILVVEDDAAVRELVRDVLGQLGYQVHAADGYTMACAIADSEQLDLLLTDVVLPGADGIKVQDAVTERQNVPCLFMTGHADDRLGEKGILTKGTEVLRKPFTARELALRVRQVLDEHQGRRERSRA